LENPEKSSPYYKWVVVGVIWLIAFLNYTDRMTIFSVLPLLKQEMGFSDLALALLGSMFLWSYALCSPIGGYLGDRFARRRIILYSLLLFSLVTFATGLAHGAFEMIGLRCLLGISEAIFLPPALAYIAAFHSEGTRSLANSIALTGLASGAGFGSWYGGYMAEHFSWRTGFFGLGAAGALVALGGMIILKKDRVTEFSRELSVPEPFGNKAREIARVPTARALIFLAFSLSLSSWPTHSWLPTYLFEKFHLTLTHAGSVISLYAAIPALLGGVAGGILADRWTKFDKRGRMAVQVIGFGVMAPCMLLMGFMPTAQGIAIDLLIYSIARGMLECNSMPIFCSVVPASRWSMAYGLYNLAGTLAGSLGIFFVGAQKGSWGIGYSLSSMSFLLFIALAITSITMLRYLARDIHSQLRLEVSGVQPIERR
jgi:MFS transporter, Spinster family, sphingosine-1-phosphate transporter